MRPLIKHVWTISDSSTLSRAHKNVPCQGRRVQSNRQAGVYGGYQGWLNRAGRDRSLGDGQVNFRAIFSKLAAYDSRLAVYEWNAASSTGSRARNGAKFIADHIIEVTDYAFDDFAATGADRATNLKLLASRASVMVHATAAQSLEGRRLRVGMVGGGREAFIGAVHRMAMRLDDLIVLTRARFRPIPRPRASQALTRPPPDRVYSHYREMAAREAARPAASRPSWS